MNKNQFPYLQKEWLFTNFKELINHLLYYLLLISGHKLIFKTNKFYLFLYLLFYVFSSLHELFMIFSFLHTIIHYSYLTFTDQNVL